MYGFKIIYGFISSALFFRLWIDSQIVANSWAFNRVHFYMDIRMGLEGYMGSLQSIFLYVWMFFILYDGVNLIVASSILHMRDQGSEFILFSQSHVVNKQWTCDLNPELGHLF